MRDGEHLADRGYSRLAVVGSSALADTRAAARAAGFSRQAIARGLPPPAVFVAEQASFLGAGVWLWLGATGGQRWREPQRTWSGVAALLFTSMHMTLLGALFALAPRVVLGHETTADALADQHLGGGLMLLIGGASYLAGGLWLSRAGLSERLTHERSAA